ncbi:MAG: formylglycine-generating enzyme family protein [Alphaproteobacteria bacterium]|nr:formylglycine-generating enzyme family protein [Alphaproteobacteria bacterium]
MSLLNKLNFKIILFILVCLNYKCKKDESITTENIIDISSIENILSKSVLVNLKINNSDSIQVLEVGVCYSSSNLLPTKLDSFRILKNSGSLNGNYSIQITNLMPSTFYNLRAFLSYNGIIVYSNPIQNFTTYPSSLSIQNLDSNMILVQGGRFLMGATSEQLTNNGDGFSAYWEPSTQQVTLSNFKICRFEVTQQLWLDVMGTNPSAFNDNLQRPVEQVTWDTVQLFIKKLNQLTGKTYRLPTEAEWEYAARGGVKTTYTYIYSGSDSFKAVGWNRNNSGPTIFGNRAQVVGLKLPNALGFYDMSGNVWEWCSDWYGDYSTSLITNPTGPVTGTDYIIRGGSWLSTNKDCRISYRYSYNNFFSIIGFRLAQSTN